jgi:hypothetical protein
MYERLPNLPARHKLPAAATLAALAAAVAMALAPLAPAAAIGGAAGRAGSRSVDAVALAVAKTPTRISVSVPTGISLGQDVTVTATLKTSRGAPLANEHVALFLDGTEIKSDRTDAQGGLSFVIVGRKLSQARAYSVQAVYTGSHLYGPSSATASMTVLAAAIQVQTVPPLPGLRFTLGTQSATTGPDGVASLPVPQAGQYQLSADLNPNTSATAIVKASFVRWLDNVYTATRTIDVTGPATYTIGLRVAYRASIRYVNLDDQPVDPALIDQAVFSTGTGSGDVVLSDQVGAQDVWWTASSIAHVSNSLIPTPITYRALSVKIHGADVVNRGQQAWTPTENGVWTIQLLLYPMSVQARDAFFGMPVSGQLQLKYPDGTTVTTPVDSSGTATFGDLPRGQYQLSLHPAAISPPSAVALSRPQDAVLRVITYLDVAVVAGGLIATVMILYAIGRGSLALARRRRARRVQGDTVRA